MDAPAGLKSAVWEYFGICIHQPKVDDNSLLSDYNYSGFSAGAQDVDTIDDYNLIDDQQHMRDDKDSGHSTAAARKATWCKICKVIIPYRKGNTTNMHKHLIGHHSIDLLQSKSQLSEKNDVLPSENQHNVEDDNVSRKQSPPSQESIHLANDDNFEYRDAPVNLRSAVWEYFGICVPKDSWRPVPMTDGEGSLPNSDCAEKSIENEQHRLESHFPKATWCKICHTKLGYHGGNTSNMRGHLRTRHNINPPSVSSQVAGGLKLLNSDDFNNPNFNFHDAPSNLKSAVWQYFGIYVRKPPELASSPCRDNSQPSPPWNSVNDDSDSQDRGFYNEFCDIVENETSAEATGIQQAQSFGISDNISRLSSQKGTWCKICKAMISYTRGNTSNMRQHLRRNHGVILPVINHTAHSTSVSAQSSNNEPQTRHTGAEAIRKDNSATSNSNSNTFLTSDYEIVPRYEEPFDGSRRNHSVVWLHFGFYRRKDSDEVLQDCTVCKACRKMIPYRRSNTSNMLSHLVRRHGWNIPGSAKKSLEKQPANPVVYIKVVKYIMYFVNSEQKFVRKFFIANEAATILPTCNL